MNKDINHLCEQGNASRIQVATWRNKPMNPPTSEHHICRFGLYEADLDAGILKRHGIPVKLQEQPFRILGFLLERPGQILAARNCETGYGPKARSSNLTAALNTALMKLRAVLNDDSENPRFVETVPKKGYRFIAPVQIVRGRIRRRPTGIPDNRARRSFPAENGQTSARACTKALPSFRELPNACGIFRCSDTVSGGSRGCRGSGVAVLASRQSPQIARVTQLTHSGRVAPNSHLVTDGARLYFVSREGGQWALMTTSINGGSVEKIASPFENTVIFDVSPDRTQLLIGPFTYEGGASPVWIWPAHGGVPHRLGDVLASEAVWSPTGDVIAIIQNNRLLTVHRDGSAIEELQGFPSSPHSPVWSADGKKLRFTIADRDRGIDEMWEAGSDGKNLRRVLPGAAGDRHDSTGVWSSEERYFLFTGGSDSRAKPDTKLGFECVGFARTGRIVFALVASRQ